jgi:hypothetical protein
MPIPKSHQRLQAWQNAAVSCGLEVMKIHDLPQPRLEALSGRLWVRFEISDDGSRSTRVVVVAPGPPDFIVVRIRLESSFPTEGEIEIGDEPFDSTFVIEGPAPMAFALLDMETRRLLLRLSVETRLEIKIGGIWAEMPDRKLPGVLPLLLAVGQRFAQSMDIPRLLAENAHQDPRPGVRLQNLLLLIRDFPEDPQTGRALRRACWDPRPQIRLRAARELGAEGRDVLLKLAESWEYDAVSAEAVALLDRELPIDRAIAILERALGARRLQTVHACLKVLGYGGTAAAVGVLAKVIEQEEGELALAAARALGATASPAAEPPLILALRGESADLRMTAVNALGRVGTVSAVLPLQEAAQRAWLDFDLHRATSQAIAEIQSRVQGASPGQLSLAGAEAGQLSLAPAEAGQMSLATDPAGQLSISGNGDQTGED